MRKPLQFAGLILLVLASSNAACRAPRNEKKAAEEALPGTPVRVVRITRQRISEQISYTGTIEAFKKIDITPEIGGKIARILVDEGDSVRQGQVLAELETESLRLQLQQAEAGLAVAQASFKDAERNRERMERLLKENAVSSQQQEQVQLVFEAAQAQLKQAQAGVDLARHAMEVSTMKAPFGGTISAKNAEVGDVINPMMGSFSPVKGIVTLMDCSRINISVDVSPADILRIRKGQGAILRVGPLPVKEFQGTVTIANLAGNPYTKKFKVEVSVDNADLTLRPGTFGEIVFEINSRDLALAVPQKALIENRFVFLAREGRASKRSVTLGIQNADLVEIVEGIDEGDAVIVEGNYGLQDGAKIEIQSEVER